MDRQWSDKLEYYVAQARRVVMAHGLAGAHREELKDKQMLSLRTELRSYRLNGSEMNKIVRSRSATPWSIKRGNVHVQTCNRCSDSACCRLVVGQPVVAQAAISEPGAYAFAKGLCLRPFVARVVWNGICYPNETAADA